MLQEALFVPVERAVFRIGEEIVGGEKESTGAASRIGDGLSGFGAYAFHHGANQSPGREMLARA